MKKIRIGDTVSFVKQAITLYGVVEKKEIRQDSVYYMIYANGKIYRIEEKQILCNFGVIDE